MTDKTTIYSPVTESLPLSPTERAPLLPSWNNDEKSKTPEDRANFFSKLTFHWVQSLIRAGYERPLEREDLFALPEGDATEVASLPLKKAWERELMRPKPSLFRALHRAYGWPFWKAGILRVFYEACVFVTPMVLGALLQSLQPNNATYPEWWWPYVLSGALFSLSVGNYFAFHWYFQMLFRTSRNIRSGLVSLMYDKSLHLSSAGLRSTGVGQAITLFSADVTRLMEIVQYLHYLWFSPLAALLTILALYWLLSYAAFGGLAAVVLVLVLNSLVTKGVMFFRQKAVKCTDSRISFIHEILQGIKVIKLYAWNDTCESKVTRMREEELKNVRGMIVFKVFNAMFSTVGPILVCLASFACYTGLLHKVLTPPVAFASVQYFNNLRGHFMVIPMTLNMFGESRVSLKRVASFFALDEVSQSARSSQGPTTAGVEIEIIKGSFKWADDGPVVVRDLDVEVKRGELLMVVGPVGSGKSSVLGALLGEMKVSDGEVRVALSNMAYVAQEPWIMNATVRDNILFGRPFECDRYQRTVHSCALHEDLAQMPNGDETVIGEKGINISGGQRQRISLARAVYSNADIYLLDDTLSAVDAHVAKHIFEHCINGVLKGKTRVFCTHNLQFLSNADHIIALDSGTVKERGTYQQLMRSGLDFAALVTSAGYELSDSDTEGTEATATSEALAERKVSRKASCVLKKKKPTDKTKKKEEDQTEETRLRGKVSMGVYKTYIKAMGGLCTALFLFVIYALSQSFQVAGNLWLARWTDGNTFGLGLIQSLLVYAAISGIACLMVLFREMFIYMACLVASKKLHRQLLHRIISATMQFFQINPAGRVVNRFSSDMDVVDQTLPGTMSGLLNISFTIAFTLAMVIVVSPYIIPVLFIVMYLFSLLTKFYRFSSRELKRLESMGKSPLFVHFSETLDGLFTIRAYKTQERFVNECHLKLDNMQQAYYCINSANRWLGLRIDMLNAALVLCTSLMASVLKDDVDPGLTGLVLTSIMSITMACAYFVRFTADFETQMSCVERIEEYCNAPCEADMIVPGYRPAPTWPSAGAIAIKDIVVSYGSNIIIKDLSMQIKAGEKIGVVGRTGAGKSTLVQALFRLIEKSSGTIDIDGVDTSKIGLYDLRSRLAVIPQDPVLFQGTIRANLDPLMVCCEADMWDALDKVNLKSVVEAMTGRLDGVVEQNGSNFSLGQRQLICLARVILKKSRVLVLDEATSSMDVLTDNIVQRTLRSSFKECTVIAIAHRLDTILDSDRILVMDGGRIAELDTPSALLAKPGGIFQKMYTETGRSVASRNNPSPPVSTTPVPPS